LIAAISPTAAAACGEGWLAVQSAPNPDDQSLLALAAGLCQSPDR
jgi:uroporphyrinogen-III synthase